MADKKISELDPILGADSATGDLFPIVDVSNSETKHITRTEMVVALGLETLVQTIWLPAAAMTPNTTNGAEALTEELPTNDVMLSYLAFDDSTEEYACFSIQMPKSWDEGTLVAQFVWKSGVTTGSVIFGLQAVAVANDGPLDVAFGTAQEVTDGAGSAADDCMISAETSAITVAGSPTAEEFVTFKVYRKAADGGDTLVGDAELLGIKIHYITDALTDS